MSLRIETNCFKRFLPISYLDHHQIKKCALIALAAVFAIGMIFSYALGAPWMVTLSLFALTLAPLYPIRSEIDDLRQRILE